MFASSMKILTLNTNNASPKTAQNDSGTQPVNKVLNNSNRDEIDAGSATCGLSHKTNKRDQKHNNKTKFVNGNGNKMQQHITQQHLQTQKFHHKNNNTNGNKLKNQQYCNTNSSNNNTSSANRKKYYQQPQHLQQHQHYQQQQQQYITAVQNSRNPSPTNQTIANNNNSSLVKNQNYNNTDLLSLQQQQNNVVKNLVNACTCLLQQNNCAELSLNSFSPGCIQPAASDLNNKPHDFQSNNTCYDNRLKGSLTLNSSQTSLSNEVQTTVNITPAVCISCWKNYNKLPQQLQLATSTTSFETNSTNALASDTNENLTKSKSSISSSPTSTDSQSELSNRSTSSSLIGLKRKSYWKKPNSNTAVANAFGTVVNRSLSSSSGYSLGSCISSANLLKEKQNHVPDNSFTLNTVKHIGKNTKQSYNEEKYSTKLAANIDPSQQTQIEKPLIQVKDKIEMTTPLATSIDSITSIKTSVSINATHTLTSKTNSHSPKTKPTTLETPNDNNKLVLKTLATNISCSSGDNKTITTSRSSSSATNTTSVTSSQNSYTLDFLHSVGVKMTGTPLRSPGTQGSAKTYGNQTVPNSSVQNVCYNGLSNQRQPRYMYNNGSNTNSSNNGNQLQQYHHHHHHQPSQLTIASFLHKDFLGGDKTPTGGTNSSRGNSSSNTRNANHYHDRQQQPHYTQQQQQTNTRFHHNYNTAAAAYQQQSAVMQRTNYGGVGGYTGGHRNSGYAYTNYQNTAGEHGMNKSNTMTHMHSRQFKNNIANYKNSLNHSQVNRKATYASSIASNGSLSSSKSFSSNSSNISNRPLQTAVNQDSNKGASNLNLAIETLPSKILNGGNQRGGHRAHHNSHHGHGHHQHHHGNQHLIMNSPNILQHQNYYNLTYVTTDAPANKAATSRSCSPVSQSHPPPSLSATNCNSPKSLDQSPGHAPVLLNFNSIPRYQHAQILAAQQHHQFQQQQQKNILNKNVIVPLSLSLPSPSPSPTLTLNSQQTPPHNIICCSQLDEASTAAAAAAASTSSASGIMASNDYDSDNSSSHSSTQILYHQSKNSSISSTSSSSTSSTSMKPQQVQKQPATAVTCTQTTPLHSPIDYCGTTTQVFSNMHMAHQTQFPHFYGNNSGGGNAVISLLNLPTNPHNFCEDDYMQQQHQQQQQQQHFVLSGTPSQRSPDHFNIAVSNHSNSSSGYWSPSFQNGQFIYQQFAQTARISQITSSSSSCGSSSASISPRLPNDDMQQQNHQRLQNNSDSGICIAGMSPTSGCSSSLTDPLSNVNIGNTSSAESVVIMSNSSNSSNSSVSAYSNDVGSGISINSVNVGHNAKRSSSQLMAQQKHRLTSQLTCQSSSSSSSSLSNGTASTLISDVRARNGLSAVDNGVHTNNGCNRELIAPCQTSVATFVESNINGSQHLPPTATQHFYSHLQSLPPPLPPHNLLYNNPQVHHIRALSSSSVHDFFTHTPPDRFLARAHLIEAKEAPVCLLNNSKWDHLSQGIWKKFINSQQTEETFKQKMRLWRYLYVFIKNAYPRYGLYLVGSTISGFGSDSSDVDMCLVSRSASSIDPRLEALFNLTVLRDCLSKSGQFENFNLIEAKVPILRFSDCVHQLEVDLNFNNCVGIKNTHLLYCYSQLDWRLRPLVLVTKLWAQYHNINNAKHMTISSYSLVLMVIHFLQYAINPPVLPCLHDIFPEKFPLLRSNDFGYVDMSETIGPYESKNTQTVGELFLLFLEYYSFFDYTQFAISVRTGGLLPINVCRAAKSIKNDMHQWKELCIEEPFDLTNTARSVYDFETFERVKAVFVASWRILQETLDLNSVFSMILLPALGSTESSNVHRNTNSVIYATPFLEIEGNVHASDTEMSYEQYEKDYRVCTDGGVEYKEHTHSSMEYNTEDSVVAIDGDYSDDEGDNNLTATNKSLIITTSTMCKIHTVKDLDRTLTPRQVKDFSFSPTSSSSSTFIKTGQNDINGNNNTNNNRTVSALAS